MEKVQIEYVRGVFCLTTTANEVWFDRASLEQFAFQLLLILNTSEAIEKEENRSALNEVQEMLDDGR
jgi:hypothetical protein